MKSAFAGLALGLAAGLGAGLAAATGLVPAAGAAAAVSSGPGAQLWVSRYNGLGNRGDGARSVAVSPDGNTVYVTGYTDVGSLNYDYGTVAYNAATGAQIWASQYGPGNASYAEQVAVSPDGKEVFVTGRSTGQGSNYDYATVAYDAATGAQLWSERYNGPASNYDAAAALAVSPDGQTVFVTGTSWSATSGEDYVTIAYDVATGAQLWIKRYNGPGNGNDQATALSVSPDGNSVFVTGESSGSHGLDYATVAYGAATGARVWASRYNGPASGDDTPNSVTVSPDSSTVYVTGSSKGASPGYDYATVGYSAATGARLWAKRYNGPGNANETAYSLAVSPVTGTVFVTGISVGSGSSADDATIAYHG